MNSETHLPVWEKKSYSGYSYYIDTCIMGDGRQLHWPAGHIPRQPGLGPLYTGPKGPRVVLRPQRESNGYPIPLAPNIGREVSYCDTYQCQFPDLGQLKSIFQIRWAMSLLFPWIHLAFCGCTIRSIEVNLPDSLSDVFALSLNLFAFLLMYNQTNIIWVINCIF